MSNTQKARSKSAAGTIVQKSDGLVIRQFDDRIVADVDGHEPVTMSLVLDIEEMFTLIEVVEEIDDDADALQTLSTIRKIMSDEFLQSVRGVDAPVALAIFMSYIQALGERLGKAFTTAAG